MDAAMQMCTFLSQILKPALQDTLSMFAGVATGFMSHELVLKGPVTQLQPYVFSLSQIRKF